MLQAELIAIGTELTLGTTVDTNSAWLAQQLATLGVPVRRITLVADDLTAIRAAVQSAWNNADLVICTGGLGPTADDLTREAVAAALNRPLEFHQDLLDQIAARFRSFGRTMSASNRQQAYVPAGARPIANPRGTAPIFLVEEHGRALFVLPGVPAEMRYLAETVIIPYLRDERGISTILLVQSLYLSGTSEAEAGEAIADLMQAEYPTVGISAKAAQYEVRISAQGSDPTQVQADVDAVAATVRQRLARYILERGPLEIEVTSLLQERQQTLAIYEGLRSAPVFSALRRANDGLTHVRGVTMHPLDEAVDADAALSLARSAAADVRDTWQTTYGLAIQPATPTDDGWTPVSIAVIGPKGLKTGERRVDLRVREAHGFVATAAFDLLRRAMLDQQG